MNDGAMCQAGAAAIVPRARCCGDTEHRNIWHFLQDAKAHTLTHLNACTLYRKYFARLSAFSENGRRPLDVAINTHLRLVSCHRGSQCTLEPATSAPYSLTHNQQCQLTSFHDISQIHIKVLTFFTFHCRQQGDRKLRLGGTFDCD